MTRKERKEAARVRCESRIDEYKKSVKSYIDKVSPTLDKAVLHVQDCAANELKKNPSMKEEIERCQTKALSWLVDEYSDELQHEDKLTERQLENWRTVLYLMIGPYANIMSDDEIELFRKKVQDNANKS
jgi:hypothetical protein